MDLVIDMQPFKAENTETIPLCEEEILLAVPDAVLERTFPGRLEEIKEQLKQHTDLTLLRDCPFLLINKGNRVRTIADEMFEEAQMTPNVVLETENIETVLGLCIKGMESHSTQDVYFQGHQEFRQKMQQQNSPVSFYSLDYAKAHGILAIGYHKGHYMSQATKEFIQNCKRDYLTLTIKSNCAV